MDSIGIIYLSISVFENSLTARVEIREDKYERGVTISYERGVTINYERGVTINYERGVTITPMKLFR